ncbi:hypothetical protein ACFW2D_17655 [Streptomyces sp. NPDC058914]|uniref:hypothetical protein n=1 Tax=Streptomyces sp. NPDC058914 TaxID=3346671 RepID=UPI0036A7B457
MAYDVDIEVQEETVDASKIIRTLGTFATQDQVPRVLAQESYRHAFSQKRRGFVDWGLTDWPGMLPDSKVWCAAAEATVLGDPVAGPVLGGATFTMNQVVPMIGRIKFRLFIQSSEPVPLLMDFWVIHFV